MCATAAPTDENHTEADSVRFTRDLFIVFFLTPSRLPLLHRSRSRFASRAATVPSSGATIFSPSPPSAQVRRRVCYNIICVAYRYSEYGLTCVCVRARFRIFFFFHFVLIYTRTYLYNNIYVRRFVTPRGKNQFYSVKTRPARSSFKYNGVKNRSRSARRTDDLFLLSVYFNFSARINIFTRTRHTHGQTTLAHTS